jgi:hypothetical protein
MVNWFIPAFWRTGVQKSHKNRSQKTKKLADFHSRSTHTRAGFGKSVLVSQDSGEMFV